MNLCWDSLEKFWWGINTKICLRLVFYFLVINQDVKERKNIILAIVFWKQSFKRTEGCCVIYRPQHLTGIQLICDICGGKLTGGNVSSSEIVFEPGAIKAGNYLADTHTAGLVFVTSLIRKSTCIKLYFLRVIRTF